MPDFGKLQTVDLRAAWPNEANAFTPWLAENLGELGEALGIELELTESEADVGDFSLDILAKDLSSGRNVVIENQLTATDHDHLGKLLTYAAGFDAAAVIWVAQSIREEHRQALDWLNQRTGAETHFFAVVVEVIRIDDSKPAFIFKPVVSPNEWQKISQQSAAATSPRGEQYRQFFQVLIDELREKYKFTGARVGQPMNWYAFRSGVSGVQYGTSFAQGGLIRVEAYIDLGDLSQNKALFDKLHQFKGEIESNFGAALEWERLDNRRACRIASYFPGTINSSPDELVAIRQGMVDRLLRLKKSLGPLLQKVEPAV